MDKISAKRLVRETLQNPFNKSDFVYLIKNILNKFREENVVLRGNAIPDDFKDSIKTLDRIGNYKDSNGRLIDVLVVYLTKESLLDRARTKLRNFIAKYLKSGATLKDAAIVAFVSPCNDDWRFSFVKMDYKFRNNKLEEVFTPAKRYSFLVGINENSHTAQSRLLKLLLNDEEYPKLEDLEEAFSVEQVTKEFFDIYRGLFLRVKDALDLLISKNVRLKNEFILRNIKTPDFAKKLLGQIIFLYFLQKKGWFGVKKNEKWGEGSKSFLRELFNKQHRHYTNFFEEILEPLFYKALREKRKNDYFEKFECKIPFLNGGLFDPINSYDWESLEICLPNDLFSNQNITKEGDIGDGILDVFDRYNFTVKEDEPLEKEVAIDPEMLGQVFENLLEVTDRKSKGTYYTPREIVHYMCQESLTNYLLNGLNDKIKKVDLDTLIQFGDLFAEHELRVRVKGKETERYSFKLPESIRKNAKLLDKKLATVRICDPAVGSGAFPVGMMNEIIRARIAITPYLNLKKERNRSKLKRETIQQSLYGVDIDSGAIEIAKLRLWLSLIVDEENTSTIEPLPNLDYRIVQGNSLLNIENNRFNLSQIRSLENLKSKYFDEASTSKKRKIKNQIDKLISNLSNNHREFDFKVYFSEIFHLNKGFDIVIANPPYIDSEAMVKNKQMDLRDYINKTYETAKGNWDLYIPFFEQGFNILNPTGILAFITPDKWIAKPFGKELRKRSFVKLTSILKAGRKVFEEAKVDSIVTIFQMQECKKLKVLEYKDKKMVFIREIDKSKVSESSFDFIFSNNIKILEKIEMQPNKLVDIAECENACATSDAYKLKLIVSNSSNIFSYSKSQLKVVNTGTISKYTSRWGIKEMTYLKDKYLSPVVDKNEFLNEFKNSYSKKALSPKIIIKGLTLLDSFLDENGVFIPGKSTLIISHNDIEDLKILLGLLNSSLASFYIKEKYSSSSYNGGVNFTKDMINNFPIPLLSQTNKRKILSHVNKIIQTANKLDYFKNPSKQSSVKSWIMELDTLICSLYGIEPEEIGMMSESNLTLKMA